MIGSQTKGSIGEKREYPLESWCEKKKKVDLNWGYELELIIQNPLTPFFESISDGIRWFAGHAVSLHPSHLCYQA